MRTLLLLALCLALGGAATKLGQRLLSPSDAYADQERLLAAFDANPDVTLKKIAAAFKQCADRQYEGAASDDIRQLAAVLTVEAIRQRVNGVDKASGKKQAVQIIQTHLRAITAKLPSSIGNEGFMNYLQALRARGVPACAISAAVYGLR